MNYFYFVLLIFCIFSCSAMKKYSRLESLPSDIKMEIIKEIIRKSQTSKQAINAVRIVIIGDRLFRQNEKYPAFQATIEDRLGWCWNDEIPLTFIPNTFTSPFFRSLPQQCLNRTIQNPELCKSQQSFELFCTEIKEQKPISQNLLAQLDLYHPYVTQKPYADTTLAITYVKKRTPLYVAVQANNLAAVQQLLAQGCDTDTFSNDGMNPLHLACSKGYKEIVALFITYKAPLDTPTRIESKTAMHFAAQEGHMDIMQMLVRAGAKRDIKNSQGLIPAQCIKGRIEV